MQRVLFILLLISVTGLTANSQDAIKYQKPPEEIVDILTVAPAPSVIFSPDHKLRAVLDNTSMPTIEDYSAEMLRIGGLRIDPASNGASRPRYNIGLNIMNFDGANERQIKGLPAKLKIAQFTWSNDAKNFAFVNLTEEGYELWAGNTETFAVKKIDDNLNMVMDGSIGFLPDNKSVLYKTIDPSRGERPVPSTIPEGPVVQENLGKKGAARTYQDLLKSPTDEKLFEYFAKAEVKIWDGSSIRELGKAGIYSGTSVSPDGKYILVTEIVKPFSYTVPYYYFPQLISIWDMDGNEIKRLAETPLIDNTPIGRDMESNIPGRFEWRADKPATAMWVEHLDEGDFNREMEYHDQVYSLDAPFSGEAEAFIATRLRFGGITWGKDDFAIVSESSQELRKSVQSSFDPSRPMATKKVIFELESRDRYNDPGRFATTRNKYGRRVLLFADKGKSLYLTGQGASPEGDRPFLDKYRIKDGEITRIWRSEAPYYETVVDLFPEMKDVVITSRESVEIPSNYYLRNLKTGELRALTDNKNPYPQLSGVSKQLVKYKRKDGLDLSMTLYLPAGYDKEKDGPLPGYLYAYPREFRSKTSASQVSGSPYRFTRISGLSILTYVTQGYAILDGAAFPIVGEDEPNDFFREQLVADAEAAIDKAVEMGVLDRKRVAVGGHSYGAFMTANLLAHSRLFAAGIAQSGAYNRTLTPFGFQSESRTFWEAPELYFNMSPFMHADKVKDPILLIHGQADNNSGTFTVQSERYYSALKGHGATVRLVLLPHESHGYRTLESVLHTQWERLQWLETYVKNKQ